MTWPAQSLASHVFIRDIIWLIYDVKDLQLYILLITQQAVRSMVMPSPLHAVDLDVKYLN